MQRVFFNETTNHRSRRANCRIADGASSCFPCRVCLGRYCAGSSRPAYSELAADPGRVSTFSLPRCYCIKFLSAVATADLCDGVLGFHFQSDGLSPHKRSAACNSRGGVPCLRFDFPPPLWRRRTATLNRRLHRYGCVGITSHSFRRGRLCRRPRRFPSRHVWIRRIIFRHPGTRARGPRRVEISCAHRRRIARQRSEQRKRINLCSALDGFAPSAKALAHFGASQSGHCIHIHDLLYAEDSSGRCSNTATHSTPFAAGPPYYCRARHS